MGFSLSQDAPVNTIHLLLVLPLCVEATNGGINWSFQHQYCSLYAKVNFNLMVPFEGNY